MTTHTAPAYTGLSRPQLATLIPELLLSGQLIDRSGMAHLISAFGREVMAEIAIEEWMAASPVYTKRMRAALGIDGDTVADLFKCMQLDIGAPPQFMDFRYSIVDDHHGSFALAHCGALMDVEGMGDKYVTSMCHDIEDPTFDATAIATNRRARMRPVHRPPRVPAGRTPHCEWTVVIDPANEELPLPPDSITMSGTQAAQLELSQIDVSATDGRVDYRGPLLDDLQFREWSHTALVRIAEEVALEHQMLALGFGWATGRRTDEAQTREIWRKQLTGIAGLTAERLRRALELPATAEGLAQVMALHPVFGPSQYTGLTAEVEGSAVRLRFPRDSAAMADGGWMTLLEPGHLDPLHAAAVGFDPYWKVARAELTDETLEVWLSAGPERQQELGEVAITRFSSGSNFTFTDRGPSLPITPINTGA